MGVVLLLCRLGLAIVFLVAGAAKLLDLPGSRRAVVQFGVPERLAGVLGPLLPVLELAVGVALVPVASARFGAIGAAALLACFIAAIGNALARGRAPDCHCFGQLHSAPAGWRTLVRNLALLAVAGFVGVAGWKDGGASATGWVARIDAPWLVAISAGIVIVALVGFQVWFSLQLLAQNGRTLDRLQAIEAALTLTADDLADPGPLGAGLSGDGLPVGSPAPEFELESTTGQRHSLGSLLAAGHPLLLVFSDAGCGPCDALLPEVARWQREHGAELTFAVVASGNRERNRVKAETYGLERVLLQADREVADAFQADGTPVAVVIGSDGRIASPTAGGAEAIATLVAQATWPVHVDDVHSPPSNGSLIGEPAPELVMADLDGEPVALEDLYRQRTLAIFWDPACGFCERMLPDLRAFEANPAPGAPQILVLTSGDTERTRAQELRSRVLVDTDGHAAQAFRAHGTPMGVLIEDGRIASPVAAGADEVLELARAGADEGSR